MKEIRLGDNATSTSESRHIEGYAIVFNSLSNDLGGFREIIEPTAIDDELIKNSDILCLMNHDIKRGVLARSYHGRGSLKLDIDEHGLHYSFEAPKTALGDEVLEGIRRGDISKCSFAFVCGEDNWTKDENGEYIRHVKKIKNLYDVSLVYHPAYDETEVKADTRGLDELKAQEEANNIVKENSESDMNDKQELITQLQTILEKLTTEEKPVEDTPKEDEKPVEEKGDCMNDKPVEKKADETPKEDEEKPVEDQTVEDENTDAVVETDKETPKEENENETEDDKPEDDKEQRNNQNISTNMTKKFSLIKAINDVTNNRSLDDVAKEVVAKGIAEMRKSGLAVAGSIQLPVMETENEEVRANGVLAQTAGAGMENIATEKLDILEPLRANMVMSQAGATYLTGLVGNVSIPAYTGSNVAWAGETAAAANGAGDWSEIKLQPHRLTAYVDVSKEFLLQDSNDAEAMLRRDIIAAIGNKLEATILGSEAGTDEKPAGLFDGVTAMTTAVKFGDIVDAEAELDAANVSGAYTYILSPKAKAALRTLSKDAGSGRFVLEDGEIEGSKALVSSNVVAKGLVVGDFSDYVIAQWGAIDLVVDNYTKATEGKVRLVVNAYFDAKPRRATSFVKRILK